MRNHEIWAECPECAHVFDVRTHSLTCPECHAAMSDETFTLQQVF